MKHWLGWMLFFSSITSPYSSELTVPLHDPGSGTFYVTGKLANLAPTQFLLDTGSSYSSIDEATLGLLQQQGEAEYVRSQTGFLANGNRVNVPLYRIQRLAIGTSCQLKNIEVAVFPQSQRPILGLNVLSKLSPFVISVHPPRLTIQGCHPIQTSNEKPRPSLASSP
ncbi:MAG: retropepsin-like aspartic protease family protein [Methylohalobius sp. ZOD2]|nr:clan AA aspartic protease [Methylothermaceae bacterium]